MFRITRILLGVFVCLLCAEAARAGRLNVPPSTSSILDNIYAGRSDLAMPEIRKMEEQMPDYPLGYLLEAEAGAANAGLTPLPLAQGGG